MTRELRANSIVKQFGGVQALKDASVTVPSGRVVGLIGRNGSGKTTLFNCITGFIVPNGGSVSVDSRDVTGQPPQDLVKMGVVRTFQTPRIHARSTVRDAVTSGAFARGKAGLLSSMLATPTSRCEERLLRDIADELLRRLGLYGLRDEEIGRLSMGLVRLVEVARGMAAGAQYLLLDEPAAGLSLPEQDVLVRQIRAVAESGVGVLLVEHNFRLVRALCDEVTVLESGRVIAAGKPDAIASNETVIASYLGATAETHAGEGREAAP